MDQKAFEFIATVMVMATIGIFMAFLILAEDPWFYGEDGVFTRQYREGQAEAQELRDQEKLLQQMEEEETTPAPEATPAPEPTKAAEKLLPKLAVKNQYQTW